MRKTRFQIAKRDVVKTFNESKIRVYTNSDITNILNDNRHFWRFPINMTVQEFVRLLESYTKMTRRKIEFPSNIMNRFSWGEASVIEIAASLKKDSYFSHYSAMYIHDLTEQVPKTTYINYEQPPKKVRNAKMVQANIDRAFRRPPRISNNVALFGDYRICLLNSKHSNSLGVEEISTKEHGILKVTGIERTLIDIVVRPSYSGGLSEVLKAYTNAADKVSINKITSMLRKLGHTYPYHQSIGFLMQKSGVYRKSQIELLKLFEQNYDFYLDYQMGETLYSDEWRIYYPKGF